MSHPLSHILLADWCRKEFLCKCFSRCIHSSWLMGLLTSALQYDTGTDLFLHWLLRTWFYSKPFWYYLDWSLPLFPFSSLLNKQIAIKLLLVMVQRRLRSGWRVASPFLTFMSLWSGSAVERKASTGCNLPALQVHFPNQMCLPPLGGGEVRGSRSVCKASRSLKVGCPWAWGQG